MQLPATSIFGEAQNGLMGMQAYAKLLGAHNTPITAIVTAITFDEDTETPKLNFKPVRPLEEDELRAAVTARDSAEATAALTMTVSQGEKTKATAPTPKGKAAAKPKPKPRPAPVEEEDEDDEPAPKPKPRPAPVEEEDEPAPKPKPRPAPVEPVEEEDAPVKRVTKPAAVETKTDLASIIGAWDDEDDE
jgi:outer membrane biosynthesis protein TonB